MHYKQIYTGKEMSLYNKNNFFKKQNPLSKRGFKQNKYEMKIYS